MTTINKLIAANDAYTAQLRVKFSASARVDEAQAAYFSALETECDAREKLDALQAELNKAADALDAEVASTA